MRVLTSFVKNRSSRSFIPLLLSAALLVVALVTSACNVSSDPHYSLGVSYKAQESYNYCGAASVQMWRLYDGLSEISQAEIHQWMANSYPACGSNQLGIRNAVNHFTRTYDADWDDVFPESYNAAAARQITSINAGVPVIPIYDYNHTGVINGGTWHQENGLYAWDTLYVHDPATGPNRQIVASDWVWRFCTDTCEQILSSSAIIGWDSNQANYENQVVYGGSSTSPGGDPPAY